ncbi:MAG: uroporphyrinogen-III synthase [Betaproteobacteria bacterium]|nr:MAG: uroporphyrinogen-III synthase [Betaproteobacteria bacterium]
MSTDFHLGIPKTTQAGPLSGKHVLITRPVMPASRTAQRLAALGATPYVFPTTIIEPPADSAPLAAALSCLDRYYAAIFVSPSAVEMTLAPMGIQPRTVPTQLQVFAPGPGTAEALNLLGVSSVLIPETSFDSDGLLALEALSAKQVSGKRIAIFRGNDGREVLRDELTKRGASVEAITAYHRRAPKTPPTGLLELLARGEINAISAMSSDAIENLMTLLSGSKQVAATLNLPLYASHPRIAETAKAAGFRNVIETQAGDAGLITSLLANKNVERV